MSKKSSKKTSSRDTRLPKSALKVRDLEGHEVDHIRPGVAFILDAILPGLDLDDVARFTMRYSMPGVTMTKVMKYKAQGNYHHLRVAEAVVPWAVGNVTFKLTSREFKSPPPVTLPIKPYNSGNWP